MKYPTEGKINAEGVIFSDELITEKEGYEAMLYTLKTYWENSGSNDLTDILSGGEYWLIPDRPADSAFWRYWLAAIEKVRKDGPPPLKVLMQTNAPPARESISRGSRKKTTFTGKMTGWVRRVFGFKNE